MSILALDLGLKRIGLAIGSHKEVITPLKAIIRKNRNQAADEVKKTLLEWDVRILVVGLAMGGSVEDEMRRRVEHFLKLVDFNGEVHLQDESYSSLEAQELMKGEMKQIKDGRIDSISAMIILRRFLEQKHNY